MKLMLLVLIFSNQAQSQQSRFIGENFFELFGCGSNSTSVRSDCLSQHGVSLSYGPPSSWSSNPNGLAQIKIEGVEYINFNIEVNPEGNIVSASRVGIAGVAPQISIDKLSSNHGVRALAQHLGMPLRATSAEHAEFERQTRAYVEKQRLENSVQRLNQINMGTVSDSNGACGVSQHEFRVGSANEIQALKTYGAGPCIILSIYDKKNKIGALAHIDAMTDMETSLNIIRNEIASQGGQLCLKSDSTCINDSMEISLIGGNSSSRHQIAQLRVLLESYKYKSLNQNILTGHAENAWLDLESGQLNHFTVNSSLKSNDFNAASILGVAPNSPLIRASARTCRPAAYRQNSAPQVDQYQEAEVIR